MSAATFTQLHAGRSYGYSWTGPKWRCDVCGRTGYGYASGELGRWAEACRRGHSPCPWCGRQLTLRLDGTPRVHTRCPERPTDAELLRRVIAEARDNARRGVRGPLDAAALDVLDRLTL